MEWEKIDGGTARNAAQLRIQLAQMTVASQLLERCAWDEASRGYLAAMNQGICRMLRIVGRLELTYRLGGEKPPKLERACVDLARNARELGARLAGLLACAGVSLEVEAPESLPAWADGALVDQMLMELVSNAAKAGKNVTLTLAGRDGQAVFTVEDDGPGIDPERVQYLFSGEEEAVPDWRRGGVGVAVARRVATLHGGTLMAGCAPGRGLRAVASIPLGTAEGMLLETPALGWDQGGFDEALVALSDILPARVFEPGDE